MTASDQGKRVSAAFVQREYVPEEHALFGRLGWNRPAVEGSHSPLVLRLALFSDGERTAGILTMDQNRARRLVVDQLRKALAIGTGAPEQQFMIHATHAHNAPGLVPWHPADHGFDRLDRLSALAEELAREARAKLQPVSYRYIEAAVPGIAGCRRTMYRQPDGTIQVGTHGPRDGADFIGVESPDVDTVYALCFEDSSGTPVGGFANFACHPTTMYSIPEFSSDYPGDLCRRLERRLGGTFIALTGIAGDQSPMGGQGPDVCAAVGSALADAILSGSGESLGPPDSLSVESRFIDIPLRSPSPEQIVTAREHLESVARGERRPNLARRLYGYAYHSYGNRPQIDDWLASEIVGMWEMRRRSETRDPVDRAELQAIRIGDVAIASVPCELFSAFGHAVRDASRFAGTLLVEQANGHLGYVPLEESFPRGGYECCFAQQSRLTEHAGPMISDAATDLLDNLASGG